MREPKRDEQEIRNMLQQLHDELEHTQTLGEPERAMMRHLMIDLREALDRGEVIVASPRTDDSLAGRLEGAVTRLEVDHPTLTSTIKKVIDTLTVAGI